MITTSPLRYPGGKARLSPFFAGLIEQFRGSIECYVEPFAGGAGAALELMTREHVGEIWINDADPSVYAFWRCVVEDHEYLTSKIADAELSIEEWSAIRKRYMRRQYAESRWRQRAFDFFYLNRTNRSGIVHTASVIGGKKQDGKWKIDARFNRDDLCKRIDFLANYKRRIKVTNLDAVRDMRRFLIKKNAMVYIDPPYYLAGDRLYMNRLTHEDHARLARKIRKSESNWVLTYDNHEEIRALYKELPHMNFDTSYSLHSAREESELLYASRSVRNALQAHSA